MSRWGILLLLAWGLALFNAGRALGAVPTDWFGFAVSAIVVIGAPVMGIFASGER